MPTIEEDREILRKFSHYTAPREGFDESKYAYCAEYTGCSGVFVWKAKALGWEIISGEMPENPSLRDVNGHSTMGDVVFMRMPRQRYEELERVRAASARIARNEGDEELKRKQIDEAISKVVGQNIELSFQFKDRNELRAVRG